MPVVSVLVDPRNHENPSPAASRDRQGAVANQLLPAAQFVHANYSASRRGRFAIRAFSLSSLRLISGVSANARAFRTISSAIT